MTVRELSQLYDLNNEIREDKRRLAELYEKAFSLNGSDMDGMPRSGTTNESKQERYIPEVDLLERSIKQKIKYCEKERDRLQAYIDSIEYSRLRRIMHLRFVQGKSWRGVAFAMGGYHKADSIKKECYRYLKKH